MYIQTVHHDYSFLYFAQLLFCGKKNHGYETIFLSLIVISSMTELSKSKDEVKNDYLKINRLEKDEFFYLHKRCLK